MKLSVLLAILVLLADVSGVFLPEASGGQDNEKPELSTATGASIIGAVLVGAGTGGYFMYRHFKKKAHFRDSVATVIESQFSSAADMYNQERYREASEVYISVLGRWGEYAQYRKSQNRASGLDSANLVKSIASCGYLDDHLEFIKQLRNTVAALPKNPYDLVNRDRLKLGEHVTALRDTVESIRKIGDGFSAEFEYGFAPVIAALDSVDQMFKDVYAQEQLNFNLKSRFFYNRAMESKDSAELNRFVQDCDYYQSEKNWCEKARLILNPPPVVTMAPADTVVKKEEDTVLVHYREVLQSARLDQLESFLKKYSGRKYRIYQPQIDTVKQVAFVIKKEVEAEMAYNKAHPLFTNADVSSLSLKFTNVADWEQQIYKLALADSREGLNSVMQARFPASLSVDFTRESGAVFLSGFMHGKKDIDILNDTLQGMHYRLNGIETSMSFLKKFKATVKGRLDSSELTPQQKNSALKRLDNASFVVRLRKSPEEYVTFYANLVNQEIKWFDFFDVSASGQKDVRIRKQPIPLIRPDEQYPVVFSFFKE